MCILVCFILVSTIIHEIILNEKENDCYLTAECRDTGTDKCCSTVSELMGGNLFLLLWIDGEDSLSSPVYLKLKYKEKYSNFKTKIQINMQIC